MKPDVFSYAYTGTSTIYAFNALPGKTTFSARTETPIETVDPPVKVNRIDPATCPSSNKANRVFAFSEPLIYKLSAEFDAPGELNP